MESHKVEVMNLRVLYTFDKDDDTVCLAKSRYFFPINVLGQNPQKDWIGSIQLVYCLLQVCNSSPETSLPGAADYSVYSKDFTEPGEPMIGYGFLSKVLSEYKPRYKVLKTKKACTHPQVSGKIKALGSDYFLEVKLKLKTVQNQLQLDFNSRRDEFLNFAAKNLSTKTSCEKIVNDSSVPGGLSDETINQMPRKRGRRKRTATEISELSSKKSDCARQETVQDTDHGPISNLRSPAFAPEMPSSPPTLSAIDTHTDIPEPSCQNGVKTFTDRLKEESKSESDSEKRSNGCTTEKNSKALTFEYESEEDIDDLETEQIFCPSPSSQNSDLVFPEKPMTEPIEFSDFRDNSEDFEEPTFHTDIPDRCQDDKIVKLTKSLKNAQSLQEPLRSNEVSKKRNKHSNLDDRLLKSLKKGTIPMYCNNCGAVRTTAWRKFQIKNPHDMKQLEMVLCNACGLYFQRNGVFRPQDIWANISKADSSKSSSPMEDESIASKKEFDDLVKSVLNKQSKNKRSKGSTENKGLRDISNQDIGKAQKWRRSRNSTLPDVNKENNKKECSFESANKQTGRHRRDISRTDGQKSNDENDTLADDCKNENLKSANRKSNANKLNDESVSGDDANDEWNPTGLFNDEITELLSNMGDFGEISDVKDTCGSEQVTASFSWKSDELVSELLSSHNLTLLEEHKKSEDDEDAADAADKETVINVIPEKDSENDSDIEADIEEDMVLPKLTPRSQFRNLLSEAGIDFDDITPVKKSSELLTSALSAIAHSTDFDIPLTQSSPPSSISFEIEEFANSCIDKENIDPKLIKKRNLDEVLSEEHS